jgi:hypothetical protein
MAGLYVSFVYQLRASEKKKALRAREDQSRRK